MDDVDRQWLLVARTAVAIIVGIGLGVVLGLTFIERACGVDEDLCTDIWTLAGMPALWALLLPVTLGHWAYRLDAPTGFTAAATALAVAAITTFAAANARWLVRWQPLLDAFGGAPVGFFVVWGTIGVALASALWWLPLWVARRLRAGAQRP